MNPLLNWTVLLVVLLIVGAGMFWLSAHGHPLAVLRVMIYKRMGWPIGRHRKRLTSRF